VAGLVKKPLKPERPESITLFAMGAVTVLKGGREDSGALQAIFTSGSGFSCHAAIRVRRSVLPAIEGGRRKDIFLSFRGLRRPWRGKSGQKDILKKGGGGPGASHKYKFKTQ